jgi:hypothetical protein
MEYFTISAACLTIKTLLFYRDFNAIVAGANPSAVAVSQNPPFFEVDRTMTRHKPL